jgi:predicted acylesterase/phospholipase RssA
MRVLALLAAFMCSACVTGARLDAPPSIPLGASPVGFGSLVRAYAFDAASYDLRARESVARVIASASDGSVDVLALSGGGAGGAFGAGLLVGLSEGGRRPQYEVITGVSTGALIAPLVFAGPDWNDDIVEAYSGGHASNLAQANWLGALFGTSIYDGQSLRKLVEHFVTDKLIAAVAREATTGRMLLVATTDLDREETVIWDMGAIASTGGPRARALFIDVLVASSSIPGAFPPVLISVEHDGRTFQEMHVDGGASVPFFVAPQIAMDPERAPENLRGGNIYVIVNGQSAPPAQTTPLSTLSIATRSFFAMADNSARTSLAQADDFARRVGMNYRFTMIPRDYPFAGPMAFGDMRGLFEYGRRCGKQDRVWWTGPRDALARFAETDMARSPAQAACPVVP